jgi:hypothetical protein
LIPPFSSIKSSASVAPPPVNPKNSSVAPAPEKEAVNVLVAPVTIVLGSKSASATIAQADPAS